MTAQQGARQAADHDGKQNGKQGQGYGDMDGKPQGLEERGAAAGKKMGVGLISQGMGIFTVMKPSAKEAA